MAPSSDSLAEIERYSLSDTDIRRILGRRARIIKYNELSKYSDLNKLLPNEKDYVVILIESQPNTGHWCSLSKYKNRYQWFDPYGFPIDADLKWASMEMRKALNEDIPYLTNLLDRSNLECIYNNVRYQEMDDDINTCGDHTAHYIYRMINDDMDLQDYYKFMKKMKQTNGYNYDQLVSIWAKPYIK